MNYAPPTAPVGQPPNQPTPVFELSGWWARAGAYIIDGIIVFVLTMVVGGILGASLFGSDPEVTDTGSGAVDLLALIVLLSVGAIYYCAIMTTTNGQTVGKQATGIRVVREDGQPVDITFAFVRQTLVIGLLFNGVGAFLVLPMLANYLWPIWDDKNQALHDKIVKSRVVKAHPVMYQQYGPPAGYGPPSTPQPPPYAPAPQPYSPPTQPYAQPPQPYAPPPGPPAPPPPGPLPPPPQPPAQSQPQPYTPPPGFENPVPEDD